MKKEEDIIFKKAPEKKAAKTAGKDAGKASGVQQEKTASKSGGAQPMRETRCVYCANATNGGCCWSENLEPVEGWRALTTRQGYMVLECPEYVPDSGGNRDPRLVDTEGCLRLLEAMMKAMRDDYRECPSERRSIEAFIRRRDTRHLFFFAEPELVIEGLRKGLKYGCRQRSI